MIYLLIDTNTIMNDVNLFSKIKDNEVNVVICTTVLDELDKLKLNSDHIKSHKAREASRNIESKKNDNNLYITNKIKRNVSFDLKVPDNRIIAHAMFLKEDGKNVVLFSEDRNLRLKASAIGIELQVISQLSELEQFTKEVNLSGEVVSEKRINSVIQVLDKWESSISQTPNETDDEFTKRLKITTFPVGYIKQMNEVFFDKYVFYHCEWNELLPIEFPKTNNLFLRIKKEEVQAINNLKYTDISIIYCSFIFNNGVIYADLETLSLTLLGEERKLTPILLTKTAYETNEEYNMRLLKLGPIPMGYANSLDDLYNHPNEKIIPLSLDVTPWNSFISFKSLVVFNIAPQKLSKFNNTSRPIIYAQFDVCTIKSEQLAVTELYLQDGRKKYTVASAKPKLSLAIFTDGKKKLIDENKLLNKELVFDEIITLSLSLYLVKQKRKWGLIDNQGRILLSLSYTSINRISDNLLLIEKGKKYGISTLSGEILLKPKFKEFVPFDGYYKVTQDKHEYLLDQNLKKVGRKLYSNNANKYIWSVQDNEKYILLDKDGLSINDLKFNYIEKLHKHLITVKENDKYGVIDLTRANEYVINAEYDSFLWLEKEKLIEAKKAENIYIYNELGDKVGERINGLEDNDSPIFRMKEDHKYLILNAMFAPVMYESFEEVGLEFNNIIPVKQNKLWGAVSTSGHWLIQPKYEYIDRINKDVSFGVVDEDKEFITFSNGELLIEDLMIKSEYKVERMEKGFIVYYDPTILGQHELYYSCLDTKYVKGNVLDLNEFTKEGWNSIDITETGRSQISIDVSAKITIITVRKFASVGIIADLQEVVYVSEVTDLSSYITNGKAYISWSWPDNVTSALISFRSNKFSCNKADIPIDTIRKNRIDNQPSGQVIFEFENDNEYLLTAYCELNTNNSNYISMGTNLLVHQLQITKIHYSIIIKRDLFGGYKKLELHLEKEGNISKIPPLVLVKRYSTPPINRYDGTTIIKLEDIDFESSLKLVIVIPIDFIEPNSFVQLFYAANNQYNSIKLIPKTLKEIKLW
ncbi:hypothetical protein CIB95_11705 [Lottiidibacillus patelloidae]|uniref:PIN domain-containing protein n=1 Tax=Lottiidibacillus patelloidae TaxID=2670334 RepID=A0A263BRU5_9BACI|nr:PIN domain-containing protein [Lottiidibacillus patelloidae]OZM56433.1 hypothetical protein CIB95_11705 [Lottiidibacillus patelloidae]